MCIAGYSIKFGFKMHTIKQELIVIVRIQYNLYFRLHNTEQHSHTVFGSIDNLQVVRYSTRLYRDNRKIIYDVDISNFGLCGMVAVQCLCMYSYPHVTPAAKFYRDTPASVRLGLGLE